MITDPPAGLYVHIPFCKTKCPYCDFYSITEIDGVSRWIDAVIKEADIYKDAFPPFDTLYLGGGTPSLLEPRDLTRLITALNDVFQLIPGTEITVEANPDDVTHQWLESMNGAGVNRLSLGVQSLDEKTLRFLNRRHTVHDSLQVLEFLKEMEWPNLSVDLIYGVPGMSSETWRATLEQITRYTPEHISCYQLTYAPGTLLHNRMKAGEVMPVSEEMEARLFITTSDFLTACGYVHYEISNFARSESLISRHNSKYWNHTPYLGLGPGAHSFKENRRWWNMNDVGKYCSSLAIAETPVTESETLTEAQIVSEKIFLGVRTRNGFPREIISSLPGNENTLNRLITNGWLYESGCCIKPTLQGWMMADRIPLEFL